MKVSLIALLALAAAPAAAQDIPRVLSAEEQLAQQAPADPACGPFDQAVKTLAERWHEVPTVSMLTDKGLMIAIFATADGETFTILAVQPNGTACQLAAGTTLAIAKPKPTGPEA